MPYFLSSNSTVFQVVTLQLLAVLYVLARQYLNLCCNDYSKFYAKWVWAYLINFHDISQLPLFVFGLLLAMETLIV